MEERYVRQLLCLLDTVRRIWRLGRSSHAGNARAQLDDWNVMIGFVDFCELQRSGFLTQWQMS